MAVSTVPFPDAEGKKKKGVLPRTLRFDLVLEDSTEESTNEYSYAHLVNDALKGNNDSVSEEDPLASDTVDTKLARIARQLEEKYGSAAKKRRIIHDADFINLGCGYDTEDSFVDDSEAIDDFVPPHMETAQGGFYINQGDLQFKKSKEIDPDDYDFSMTKKSLPPKLTRQPSTQATLVSQKVKQAKKTMLGKKGVHLGHTRKTSHGDTPHSSGHIKNKIKKFGGENKARKKTTLAPKGEPPSSPSPKVVEQKESASDKGPATGSGQASLFVSTTSSVKSESPSKNSKTADAVSPISSENEGDGSLQEAVKGPPPPLPRDLPNQLLSKIEDLKQAFAKETAGDKKLSIKGRQMLDTQMIEIEKDCGKNLTVKTRTGVYDHIAGVMNVKRASIMSRTVKTMKKREEEKLSQALNLLRKDVDLRMVTQMKKYEDEVMVANLCASTGPVGGSPGGERMDTSAPGTVGDENSTISTISSASSLHSQPAKAKKVRKHFKWDSEIKQHLLNVVTIKINNEVTSQRKLTGVDDLVGRYLDECVKPLWPKGWMSKGILLKMSESAYKHLLPVQDQPLKKTGTVQSPSVSNSAKVTSTVAVTSTPVPSSTTASAIKQPSSTAASTVKQQSLTAASTINQLSSTAASTINQLSSTAASAIKQPSLTGASTINKPSLTAASTVSTPSLTAVSTINSPSQTVACTISTPSMTTATVSQMPSIVLTPITSTSTISTLSSVDSMVRITTIARKPILTSTPTDTSRTTDAHPVVSNDVTVGTTPSTGNTSDKASSPQILAGASTQEKTEGSTLSLETMAKVKDLLSSLKDLSNPATLSVAGTLLKIPSISPSTSHSEIVTPIVSPKTATSPNLAPVSKSSSAITISHSQVSKPISTSQWQFSTLHPRPVLDTKESSKGIIKKEPVKRLSTKEPRVHLSPLSSSPNSPIVARSQSSANNMKSLISSSAASHSAEIVQTMSPLQATLQQSSPRVSQSSQILSEHSYQVSPTSVDVSSVSVSVGGVGVSDSPKLTSGLQPLPKDKVDPNVLEEDEIH